MRKVATDYLPSPKPSSTALPPTATTPTVFSATTTNPSATTRPTPFACLMNWFLSEPSLEVANPTGLELEAAPPRFEHGFEAPQASVISKLHYRAVLRHRTPQYKREGEPLAGCTRVHGRCARRVIMVLKAERSVEFSMVDLASIAYCPRIFDLAHRFFESVWDDVCGQSLPASDQRAEGWVPRGER